MKKFLLALLLSLAPSIASAQCNGVFPPQSICGNPSGSPATPSQASMSLYGIGLTIGTTPIFGGTDTAILYDSAGFLADNGPFVSALSNPTTNGQWSIGATTSLGAVLIGQGSTDDVTLQNKAGATVLAVPTGTGHLTIGSGTPTANTCAGFALGTGSTDVAGRVTFTSATSCAINFGVAFTNAPFCVVSPGSAASTHFVTTTTAILTATFGTAQTAMFYHCFGA